MASLLIVDDDQDFSSAVATFLRNAGHQTVVEDSPDSALAYLKNQLPDAVVLDVMFPESPSAGFELARAIRRLYKNLPILMLTAVNQQYPLGFSTKDIDPDYLPVTDFLEKPIDFRVLCEKVSKLVASSQG
jgi:two-component system NtrC family response regulator/two-component system nitrogen regulation response regulator GlnG